MRRITATLALLALMVGCATNQPQVTVDKVDVQIVPWQPGIYDVEIVP